MGQAIDLIQHQRPPVQSRSLQYLVCGSTLVESFEYVLLLMCCLLCPSPFPLSLFHNLNWLHKILIANMVQHDDT